jgi:integrase
LRFNPADACILPRIEKAKITPLDDAQISDFLTEIRGNRFESIFAVTLFTGMREGEVLGLTWDCIDFERSTIINDKQIQLHQEKGSKAYELASTKNGKIRSIVAAPSVMSLLKRQKLIQAQQRLMAGSSWQNHDELVFTDSMDCHLTKPTVYREFKRVVAAIGRPDARFHDLRHSCAVAAILG